MTRYVYRASAGKKALLQRQGEGVIEPKTHGLSIIPMPVRVVLVGESTVSLNRLLRVGYWTRSAMRRDWWMQLLVTLRGSYGARVAMHRPTGKRYVRITRQTPKFFDFDNFVGGCKVLVDAMVDVGLIAGDSAEWVEVEYRQIKGPKAMTIEVADVPQGW